MSSQATESTRSMEFLAWAMVNRKKLLIVAAVVATLIGAFSIYRWSRNEAEAEASAALFKVQTPLNRMENTAGPGSAEFLKISSSHPGTSAGAQALLLGAEGLFHESKYAEAKTQFESFLRDHSDSSLAASAAYGVATCLDAMDKTNEALAAYQGVASSYGGSAVASQAKLGLARLYEVKSEPAQALRIYDELSRPTAQSQSSWSSEALMRREQLLSRHPELTKTNAPVATAPAPATLSSPLTVTNPAPSK